MWTRRRAAPAYASTADLTYLTGTIMLLIGGIHVSEIVFEKALYLIKADVFEHPICNQVGFNRSKHRPIRLMFSS